MPAAPPPYTWGQLRNRPLRDLQPDDIVVQLDTGQACRVSPDGTVRGLGRAAGPRGHVWTITGRDGNCITAKRDDGHEEQVEPPKGHTVLVVEHP